MFSNAFNSEPAYFLMAVVGSILFGVKLIMGFIGADGDALDTDFPSDLGVDDIAHADSGASFSVVSLQSMLAFLMGAGWIGLAARLDWGYEKAPSLLVACGFGTLVALLSATLSYMTQKMNNSTSYNIQTVVGKVGKVYLPIPAKGSGMGQVEVSVNGKQQILNAISSNDEIDSFTPVTVLEAKNDDTVLVEPV